MYPVQNEKKLKRIILPAIVIENLAMYCYRLPKPVNPFTCPTSVMADFIRTIYISGRFGKRTNKSGNTFTLSNSARSTVRDDTYVTSVMEGGYLQCICCI